MYSLYIYNFSYCKFSCYDTIIFHFENKITYFPCRRPPNTQLQDPLTIPSKNIISRIKYMFLRLQCLSSHIKKMSSILGICIIPWFRCRLNHMIGLLPYVSKILLNHYTWIKMEWSRTGTDSLKNRDIISQ